jgi:hypothetical protein
MQVQKKYRCGNVLLSSILFTLFFSLMYVNHSVVLAVDDQFMAGKHTTKGIACNSCHKETPPKNLVPTEVCFECHGNYAKLAAQTKKITPNPHEHHNGELPCEACHHAHKPSENQCRACHNFNFNVP